MNRHICRHLSSVAILVILVIPIISTSYQGSSDYDIQDEPAKNLQVAGTNTTWYDDCTSTNGWISQNTSSGFDPKHVILESGTLSTTGGYLTVTGITDPVSERKGPLFIKELGDTVSIDAIEMFQAEVQFTYLSDTYGFLSIYLFDENKQKAVMLRLHDAWAASESHPESTYFTPGEAGDGTLHDEILFGSWSGYLRFWYNEATGSLVGELDDGTPNQATLKTSGDFDSGRSIKYIGIQWSRHPGANYNGDTYRLLDVQLTYDDSETEFNWLTGWMNRKSHQILGTSGAGVNYQVKMTVNYGSGTDSDNNVYTDFKCQPDFDDVRFTDDDGHTLLDYWTESVYDSDNATFWVEVKDDLDFDTMIHMYYGNNTVSSLSNGSATFIFFDDYENNNLDRWDGIRWDGTVGSPYSCATDQVVHGTYALKFDATPGADIYKNLTETGEPLTHDFMVHSWVRDDNQIRGGHAPLVKSQSEWWVYACRGYDNQFSYLQDAANYVHWPQNYTGGSDEWFEINVGLSMSTDKIRAWKNEFYMGEIGLLGAAGQSVPDDLFQIGYGQQSSFVTWWDDTYVRKWVVNEPVHESWSDDQTRLIGWNNRKSHEIIGSIGAGVNYQIEIVVHYGNGTDIGEDVYCGEQCQVDFDEIRFTDDDGYTLLDYWTESVYDSDNATFWVEVKDDLDFDTTIYMYYGNTTASSLSNGSATFIFFDDFENDSVGSWPDSNRWWITAPDDEDANNWVKVVQDPDDSSNQALGNSESGDTIANGANTIDWGPVGPVAIGQKFRYDLDYKGYFAVYNETDWLIIEQLENLGENDHEWFNVQDYSDYTPPITTATDTWYSWEYRISPDGMILFDRNRGTSHMGGYVFATYDDAVSATARYGLRMGANTWWTDDMYVRKFVSSEPAHGAWDGFTPDPIPASIVHVEDFDYEAGTSGNVIEWTTANFNPTSYELWRDEGLVTSDAWPGGSSIDVDIDNLAPGEYNYTIIVYGDNDVIVSDIVIVTVIDSTSPSLGHPMDVTYEYGSTGHSIVWSVSDLYPDEYVIYKDGISIVDDVWTGGTILLDVDELAIGEYNYTIRVSDATGNSVFDTAIVTVLDTTAPILTHPSDIQGDLGAASIQIAWVPTDHLPFNYEIYQNGTQVSSGTWTSGENLTYTLDEVVAGSYNITIVVWDTSGNYDADTVFISIDSGQIGDYLVISLSMGGLVVIVIVVGLICRNRRGPRVGSPTGYDW